MYMRLARAPQTVFLILLCCEVMVSGESVLFVTALSVTVARILGTCYVLAPGATLGIPFPTRHSWDLIAVGLLGLPWGYLCQRVNHWL